MKRIPIKEEHKEGLEILIGNLNTARAGYNIALENIEEARKELWNVLHREYPETVGHKCTFRHPSTKDKWGIWIFRDDSIDDIKAHIEILSKKVNELEK